MGKAISRSFGAELVARFTLELNRDSYPRPRPPRHQSWRRPARHHRPGGAGRWVMRRPADGRSLLLDPDIEAAIRYLKIDRNCLADHGFSLIEAPYMGMHPRQPIHRDRPKISISPCSRLVEHPLPRQHSDHSPPTAIGHPVDAAVNNACGAEDPSPRMAGAGGSSMRTQPATVGHCLDPVTVQGRWKFTKRWKDVWSCERHADELPKARRA
jgi:hypothetical protein